MAKKSNFLHRPSGILLVAFVVAAIAYVVAVMMKPALSNNNKVNSNGEESSSAYRQINQKKKTGPAPINQQARAAKRRIKTFCKDCCNVQDVASATSGGLHKDWGSFDSAHAKYNTAASMIGFKARNRALNVPLPCIRWRQGQPCDNPWPQVCHEIWSQHSDLELMFQNCDFRSLNQRLAQLSNEFHTSAHTGYGN